MWWSWNQTRTRTGSGKNHSAAPPAAYGGIARHARHRAYLAMHHAENYEGFAGEAAGRMERGLCWPREADDVGLVRKQTGIIRVPTRHGGVEGSMEEDEDEEVVDGMEEVSAGVATLRTLTWSPATFTGGVVRVVRGVLTRERG